MDKRAVVIGAACVVAAILILLIVALPALAFTPEELRQGRPIKFECDESKCTVSREDFAFLAAQNQYLGGLLMEAFARLKACQFKSS